MNDYTYPGQPLDAEGIQKLSLMSVGERNRAFFALMWYARNYTIDYKIADGFLEMLKTIINRSHMRRLRQEAEDIILLAVVLGADLKDEPFAEVRKLRNQL